MSAVESSVAAIDATARVEKRMELPSWSERRSEPCDTEIIGHRVEIPAQRRADRNSVASAGVALDRALLSRHPDAVDARHAFAVAQVANERVDRALEFVDLAEGRHVDHADGLSGVGHARDVLVEIDR